MNAGGLIGAVLRPHDGEDAELGERWGAAEGGFDAGVLVGGDVVGLQERRRDHGRYGFGFLSWHGSREIVAWYPPPRTKLCKIFKRLNLGPYQP